MIESAIKHKKKRKNRKKEKNWGKESMTFLDRVNVHDHRLPWVYALDSHFAKLAIPRATCARTSGCPHLTIPSNALMPPSLLSFDCNLSVEQMQITQANKQINKHDWAQSSSSYSQPRKVSTENDWAGEKPNRGYHDSCSHRSPWG